VATSHTADLVGRVLGGRYRLTRRLGQGAFAQVYVADDVTLRRRVAIKVLNPGLADERSFLRRFTAEAQAVAALRHPHILRIYDWGEDDGDPYLVMELLEGGSLRSYLDQGRRLSPAQAARVGADVAHALDYAQRRGLIHRDVKPANLIFDDEGRIALADFGLARAMAEATLTEPTGAVIGTARYAAPEQIHGESLDHRADVYALALVLVEATTGQVPFAADTSLATLMRRLRQPITVGSDIGPLGAILEEAGTVEAADRLDAAGLAQRLDELAARLPPPARLVLAGPLVTGVVETDYHPTEIPGRTGLFDIEAVETGESRRPSPAGLRAGGSTTLDPPAGAPASPTARSAPTPPPTRSAPPRPVERRAPATSPSAPSAPSAPSPAPSADEDYDDTDHGNAADHDGGDYRGGDYHGGGYRHDQDYDDAVESAGEERRPRRRRRRILLALIGVVVVAGAAVAGYELTRPAATYPVPGVRGDTVAAATAALVPQHLKLTVSGHSYSPTAAVGTILSQQPVGGRLSGGRSVRVVVSQGPRPIAVPSLVNLTLAQATAHLSQAGLRLGAVTKATSMTVAAGSVISASPGGGTLLPQQTVAIVVSTGKPTVSVPRLSGSDVASYAAASAALEALGLKTTETEQYSTTVPDGEVIVTDPAPGATATVGSSVVVVVSKGPQMVAVPNVTGDSVSGAAQALTDAGLSASGVSGNPVGTVESTSPGDGTSVVIGSSVELYTG
jgi:eukaryotic-like serine/threonine-protein kinase